MSPCFLGGENENRREQTAKRVEDFAHGRLCGASTSRVCGIAIHPVFRHVDVETAQIDRAKLIERVINLVKLERFVSRSTIGRYLIEPLENPGIDQCKICFPA